MAFLTVNIQTKFVIYVRKSDLRNQTHTVRPEELKPCREGPSDYESKTQHHLAMDAFDTTISDYSDERVHDSVIYLQSQGTVLQWN